MPAGYRVVPVAARLDTEGSLYGQPVLSRHPLVSVLRLAMDGGNKLAAFADIAAIAAIVIRAAVLLVGVQRDQIGAIQRPVLCSLVE